MSDNEERPPEPTPIAGEIASGIFQIMNTALKMGANITKGVAEITSGGEPVRPPKGTQDPINSMLHYGATTVSNVIRLVIPSNTTQAANTQTVKPPTDSTNASVPQKNIPTVRQGSTLRVPLMIENPHAEPYLDMAFQCFSIVTDTLADGVALRLDNVRLEPEVLNIAPGDFEKLTVYVDVPNDAAVGMYEIIIGQEAAGFETQIPVHVIEHE